MIGLASILTGAYDNHCPVPLPAVRALPAVAFTMSRRHTRTFSRVDLGSSSTPRQSISIEAPSSSSYYASPAPSLLQRPSRRLLLLSAAALLVLVALLHQNGVSVPQQVVKPISDQLDLKKWTASTGNGLAMVFGGYTGADPQASEQRITLIAMW